VEHVAYPRITRAVSRRARAVGNVVSLVALSVWKGFVLTRQDGTTIEILSSSMS